MVIVLNEDRDLIVSSVIPGWSHRVRAKARPDDKLRTRPGISSFQLRVSTPRNDSK